MESLKINLNNIKVKFKYLGINLTKKVKKKKTYVSKAIEH